MCIQCTLISIILFVNTVTLLLNFQKLFNYSVSIFSQSSSVEVVSLLHLGQQLHDARPQIIQNIPGSSFLHTFYIGDLVSTVWFFWAFSVSFWTFWPKHFDFIQNIPESLNLHTFYIRDLVSTFCFFSQHSQFLFEHSDQNISISFRILQNLHFYIRFI